MLISAVEALLVLPCSGEVTLPSAHASYLFVICGQEKHWDAVVVGQKPSGFPVFAGTALT